MSTAFDEALKFTLKWEGGVAHRSKEADPGGLTNRGVTQATYNSYRKSRGLGDKSVIFMTDRELEDIYRKNYWDKIYVEEMPERIAIAAFDFAVHSGPNRAVKYLQKLLGVNADGVIGPITKQALENCDEPETLKHYIQRREMFLRNLPNFKHNPGWMNRTHDLKKFLGVKV